MSKPKNVLINATEEYLVSKFQKEGFKWYPKSTKFKKRNKNGFIYEFNFLGSKTNWQNDLIDFRIQHLIFLSKYKTWGKKHCPSGTFIGGGYLPGKRDILSKNKTRNGNYSDHYDFVNFKIKDIMVEIWENYNAYGKAYFESASSWEKIHNNAMRISFRIDSLIFQNKIQEAIQYASKSIIIYENQDKIHPGELQSFNICRQRLEYLNSLDK